MKKVFCNIAKLVNTVNVCILKGLFIAKAISIEALFKLTFTVSVLNKGFFYGFYPTNYTFKTSLIGSCKYSCETKHRRKDSFSEGFFFCFFFTIFLGLFNFLFYFLLETLNTL